MSSIWKQTRYTLRKLARTPVFSVVSVLTLALAIGANTAVFSVVNGVLLKPLPFDEPETLVGVWHTAPGLGFPEVNQSPALHFTYRDEGTVFEDIGMWAGTQVTVTGLEEPEHLSGMRVTASTLSLLHVRPAAGRLFSEEDDTPDAPQTVVLSHDYWQQRFGADPGIVGDNLIVDGVPRQIIGVTPADVEFLDYEPAVYLPFRFDRSRLFVGNFSYQGLARLKPGVTLAQANAEIERLIPVAVDKYPGGMTLPMLQEARFGPDVHPLKQDVVGNVGDTLWVILGTVAMVLLIACANVANLFLVRSEGRQLEMAVRTALGASRGQVARGFLAESLALGGIGGLMGLGLAAVGLRLLVNNAPQGLPRVDEIGLDPVVIAFTAGLSILAGILFGLVPVVRYRGEALTGAIKEGGRGGSAGKERHRARNVLVVAQVALALVLLIGSGLMIRSFQALRNVDLGITDPGDVLTLRLTIPSAEVEDTVEMAQTHLRIADRLAEIPGVESVALTTSPPMGNWNSNDPVFIEGFPVPDGQIPPIRRFKWIGPGYLETIGTPLVAGRAISRQDIEDQADVAMISENMAREYWDTPAEAIGKRLRLPTLEAMSQDIVWREIVGVVADVHEDGPDQKPPTTVYWPMVTRKFWDSDVFAQRSMAYLIRSERIHDGAFLDEVRRVIWAIDSNLPLANVRTMQEIVSRSMARTSFTLVMLAIAAGVALVLGAVGIYGVTSYVVSQRTREIGVRMALGAQRADVSRMVVRQGLVVTGIGVGVGLAAAFLLTRAMAAILFGVDPLDPTTYVAVATALSLVALLACYLPARRAAGVDPVVALRFD